jgi:hypothetical protein
MTTTVAITYEVRPYHGETTPLHSWRILDANGATISELYVDTHTLEVRQIETLPAHRGEGHATALWDAATAMFPVCHSHEAHRTDAGNRFAARVGGATAPCTDDCDCDTAAWADTYDYQNVG